MELAGSLLALVDWLETGAECKSAVLSSSKPTRSPSLNGHGLGPPIPLGVRALLDDVALTHVSL